MNNERDASDVTTVVVIGASGFIGEHLLVELANRADINVRAMVHQSKADVGSNVTFVDGDLLDERTLDAILTSDCIVINLAYLVRNNLEAMANLANACVRKRVRRLIHCSTAVVVGRTSDELVTELSTCHPVSEYEKTKLQMEKVLFDISKGRLEVTILRPTAVFGPGSKNLIKLANRLLTESMWGNYIRSCIFNHRTMNLVAVENVIAALVFLLREEHVDREIFIISDDDSPINNYRDIEDSLLATFGRGYAMPRIPIPMFILSILLRMAGKSGVNPSTRYSSRKLAARGFNKPLQLEVAIDSFAKWFPGRSVGKA
jgi:nucleoside-diphosphate-sugar epimerase